MTTTTALSVAKESMRVRNRRAEVALSILIEKSPGFAGLVLWCAHIDVDTDKAPNGITTYGWASNKDISYTPSFSKLSLNEQVGVTAHEVLHVAFRHSVRARKLAAVTPRFKPLIFNIAADSVINEPLLSQRSWMTLPGKPVFLSEILKAYENWRKEKGLPKVDLPATASWAVEDVYRFLVKWSDELKEEAKQGGAQGPKQKQKQKGQGTPQPQPQGGGQGDDEQDETQENGQPGGQKQQKDPSAGDGEEIDDDEAIRRMLRQAGIDPEDFMADLMAAESDGSPLNDDHETDETRRWRQRLERAKAGDRPNGILRQLSGDLPKVDTPWELILRTHVLRATMSRTHVSWERPSRHWLSLSQGGRDHRYPYEAGIVFHSRVAKIVVMVDTSGSIDQDMLNRFAAEIDAIAKQTRAEIHVIVCDADVHGVFKVASAGLSSALKGIEFKGGGGTNFIPAFEEAEKLKPAIGVYLTDMMGTFPPSARFPTVWAVPAMSNQDLPKAPFGVTIPLR